MENDSARRRIGRPVSAPASDPHRLEQIVGRFKGRRVAALVDLVVDEFVHGEIERVSREAPVLILRQARVVAVPGGGGNAVANLRALGARPLAVGIVGRDDAGRRLTRHFRDHRIATGAILAVSGRETPTKSRVIGGGVHTRRQQIVRVDRGPGPGELPAELQRRLRASLAAALASAEGLLVADYGYGVATPETVGEVLRERSEIPVVVDSRARVGRFSGVSACTPNQEELERALGLPPLGDDAALEKAGRELLRRCRSNAVLVTRGSKGMCLFERRRAPAHVPPFGSDEVADVTGAGDTVTAVFTLALVAGATHLEAARLANYAAGLVVMKAGTATVRPEELLSAIREDRS